MSSIKLKHASGNGVIIAAPSSNPAADRTLTLPSDADGVIAKTDSSGNLTVAGDLTVDTSTLKVDSSNNRVGIGTTSPNSLLNLHGVFETNAFEDANGQSGRYTAKGFLIGDAYSAGKTSSDDRNSIIWNERGLDIVFATNDTERMKIDSSGHFLFNCTSLPSSSVAGMAFERNGSSGVLFHSNGSSTGSINVAEFINGNGTVGRINTDGSTTTYHTSSDYRLKENQIAISDGITRLKSLKPYRFNFKADSTKAVDGFFAHEVSPVVPEAIWGEKDAVKEDGSINPQGIDQSKLVPLLVAALQEAIAKIETLETENDKLQTNLTSLTARVAALEAK